MTEKKSLSLLIMDPPYESSNTMTALRIVESALRKGVDVTVLLTGNAVNYAVEGHATEPLALGGGKVPHPFDPPRDIERMADGGVGFFLVREDAEERGIDSTCLMGAVEAISRADLPELVGSFDAVWHW